MFAKLSTVALALAALALAAPAQTGQCNTGDVQCCNSVHSSSDNGVAALLALIGVPVGQVTGQVGFGCSPVTAIGAGSGANCVQQPVCCENNSFNGLVNLGCSPINAVL